jgi:HTH-type transcriptional regulator/antitoxin HigA
MLTPIKNEDQYNQFLKRIEELIAISPNLNTEDYDELELLTILIEHYENEHYALLPPDPIEAIKFRMEQMGLNRKDLSLILGNNSRVSDLFNHKRKLSINMVRNLKKELGISADILIS